MDCTICVAKTKALISFAVTEKLICVFVFAYAKCWFSHDEAQLSCTATEDGWRLEILDLGRRGIVLSIRFSHDAAQV